MGCRRRFLFTFVFVEHFLNLALLFLRNLFFFEVFLHVVIRRVNIERRVKGGSYVINTIIDTIIKGVSIGYLVVVILGNLTQIRYIRRSSHLLKCALGEPFELGLTKFLEFFSMFNVLFLLISDLLSPLRYLCQFHILLVDPFNFGFFLLCQLLEFETKTE